MVTSETTATEYSEYTVTFIIDGSSYSQQVAYGQAAQPHIFLIQTVMEIYL
jgi:hypothetical protein